MDLISKIGLGTVQFGLKYGISNFSDQTPEEEVTSILFWAKEKGIDLLDTAHVYGNSEEILGNNNLNDFQIVSKFTHNNKNQTITDQLKNSLKLLKKQILYGYLAHEPIEIAKNSNLWNELVRLKEWGLVEKIGFSFNDVEEVDSILSLGYTPDIIQVPYNYLDNRFQPYMIELKERGCEIHSRSAFLQGLFFTDSTQLNDHFNEVKPLIVELQKNGKSLAGMLLKYCLEKPFIDKVIFGVNTLDQFIENLNNVLHVESLPSNLKTNISEKILMPSKWPN